MNGRVYDPLIGRFLSADPHIQAPGDLQNYNRYSYVNNNPLSFTDPTGYFLKKLFKKIGRFFKKYWRVIVAIVASIVAFVTVGITAGAIALLNGATFTTAVTVMMVAGTLAGGFVGGLIASGGSLKGAFLGMLSAGIAMGIGGAIKGASLLTRAARAMAHGIRGGVISSLGGGKFKGGFLAGFLSGGFDEFSEASGLSDSIGWTGGLVSAAVVGGTAETIGGGKFENGAVTGAFGYLFNKAQHPERGRNANKGAWLKMSEITEYWGNAMNKLKDYIVNAINDPLAPGSEVVAGIEGAGAVFDERTLTIGLTGRGSNFFMAEGGVGLYIRWKINDITDLRFDVGYYKSVSIGAGIFDTGISVSGASYNNYDALDLRVGSINGSYHYYGGSVYYGESGDYMGVGTSLGLSLFKGGASTGYFFSSGAKMHSFINN